MLSEDYYAIIDYETRATVPFGKQKGAVSDTRYASHKDTDIICMGWDIAKRGKVIASGLWIPMYGQKFPSHLKKHIRLDRPVECHKKSFDQNIHRYVAVKKYGAPKIKEKQWRCSLSRCAVWTVPMALAKAAPAMKCYQRKDKKGAAALRKCCKPKKRISMKDLDDLDLQNISMWNEDYEDLEIVFDYCEQDIRTQRELSNKLPAMTRREYRVWRLDQKINQRGIYVDVPVVEQINKRIEFIKKRERRKISKYTKGVLNSEDNNDQLILYCASKGVDLENTQKDYLGGLLEEGDLPKSVKKAIKFRLENRKSSLSRYQKILDSVDQDGRLRNALQYGGAQRTTRWAGRGVQPQSLFRSLDKYQPLIKLLKELALNKEWSVIRDLYGNEVIAFVSLLRSMFCAPEGRTLLCCDFSGVEARILFWLSGNYKYLDAIRKGKDPYILLAAAIYEIRETSVTNKQRFFGKTGILSLGYGLGNKAFYDQCDGNPLVPPVDREFTDHVYSTYHRENPETKRLWQAVEKAMKDTVKTGHAVRLKCLTFSYRKGDLFIKLPSGRDLRYAETKLENGRLECMAVDSKTKNWLPYRLWGSRVTGHIVQGIARDLMVEGMFEVDTHGAYDIIFTVHDEVVVEADIEKADLAEFQKLMVPHVPWIKGCPIDVDGWIGPAYTKG